MSKVKEALQDAAQEGQDYLDGMATLTAMGITPKKIGEIHRKLEHRLKNPLYNPLNNVQ